MGQISVSYPPVVVNDMRVFIDRVLQPMIDSNEPYTSKLQEYLPGNRLNIIIGTTLCPNSFLTNTSDHSQIPTI